MSKCRPWLGEGSIVSHRGYACERHNDEKHRAEFFCDVCNEVLAWAEDSIPPSHLRVAMDALQLRLKQAGFIVIRNADSRECPSECP